MENSKKTNKYIQTSFEGFINENNKTDKNIEIGELFEKYSKLYEPEFDKNNHIKFHYGEEGKGGMKALRESLEMIGNGDISEIDDDHLMYKEMFKNDTLILVVHARLSRTPYGDMIGYRYNSVGLYRNNPTTNQIGGGYGTPGMLIANYPKIVKYEDSYNICYNKHIISKVCEEIKEYAIENY